MFLWPRVGPGVDAAQPESLAFEYFCRRALNARLHESRNLTSTWFLLRDQNVDSGTTANLAPWLWRLVDHESRRSRGAASIDGPDRKAVPKYRRCGLEIMSNELGHDSHALHLHARRVLPCWRRITSSRSCGGGGGVTLSELAKVAELLSLEEGASRGLSSLLFLASGSVRLSSGPRRVEQVRSATSEPRWRLRGFRIVLVSCALLPLQILAVASAQRVPSGHDVGRSEMLEDCSKRVVVAYPSGETLSDRIASRGGEGEGGGRGVKQGRKGPVGAVRRVGH